MWRTNSSCEEEKLLQHKQRLHQARRQQCFLRHIPSTLKPWTAPQAPNHPIVDRLEYFIVTHQQFKEEKELHKLTVKLMTKVVDASTTLSSWFISPAPVGHRFLGRPTSYRSTIFKERLVQLVDFRMQALRFFLFWRLSSKVEKDFFRASEPIQTVELWFTQLYTLYELSWLTWAHGSAYDVTTQNRYSFFRKPQYLSQCGLFRKDIWLPSSCRQFGHCQDDVLHPRHPIFRIMPMLWLWVGEWSVPLWHTI